MRLESAFACRLPEQARWHHNGRVPSDNLLHSSGTAAALSESYVKPRRRTRRGRRSLRQPLDAYANYLSVITSLIPIASTCLAVFVRDGEHPLRRDRL